MEYYFLALMPFFVCATLTAVMLLELLLRPTRALRALTVFMAVATLLYFCHSVFFCREIAVVPFTDSLYCACNLLVFPLYYIYIMCLTSFRIPLWQVAVLVAPGLCFGLAVGVLYLLMEPAETAHFIDSYLYNNRPVATGLASSQTTVHIVAKTLFGLELLPILWLGFSRINSYDHQLEHYYSSLEDKQLTWVKLMLIIFTGTSVISFASSMVGRHRFTDDVAILVIPSTLFSLLLFAVGYIGMKQRGIEELHREDQTMADTELAADMQPEPADASQAAAPSLSLKQRIEQAMDEQQLYLNPQLKLSDLVQLLNTNRNYIYQAINVDMQMSFSEYVNRKRVDHAIRLMHSHPELPLSEISARSGFASPVSFYRNFKAIHGCSPNELRKKT